MTRWLALTGILAISLVAVVFSELRKVDTPASPAAILYLVADTEQELSRMPVNFTRMSDQDEIRIGNQIAQEYSEAQQIQSVREDAEIQAYITKVGSGLATHAHRKLPYKFHYIPDKSYINAFALPGGHVYIGGGLLALMDSEDELAAVLGHEIEHVDHYHCAERVQEEQALHRLPLAELIALPVQIFEAGYSKDQELEADREGTRLSVESGYSPAGAIRMFETFQRLYNENQSRPRNPQDEMSQVAAGTIEGYFRSHPLPSERIQQINQMIASQGWPSRSERDISVAYILLTTRAKDTLSAGLFAEAQQLATRSLQLHAGQEDALKVQAEAQFAQADFTDAATSYRELLVTGGWDADLGESYALSLAAANRKSAAIEFRHWMASAKGDPHQMEARLDGLLLLVGDTEDAKKRSAELRANLNNPSIAKELSDLGWWHYMAADYATAFNLLEQASQLRPDDTSIAVRFIWTEIEQRRFASALQIIKGLYYGNKLHQFQSDVDMAQAVARWQAEERDDGLREFQAAILTRTTWENPQWVKALYSPQVAQTIQEMQLERERRRKVAVVHGP